MYTISASILAGNHANLAGDVIQLERSGADSIHVDIMDGHFVNNLTFGPKTVEDLRKVTSLPIDVHLEMYKPELLIDSFIAAGSTMITVQFEGCQHPLRTLEQIKRKDCQASLSFAPVTSIEQIKCLLPFLDHINLLTVEPGFGGQRLRREVLAKVRRVSNYIKEEGRSTVITVDGGVNAETIPDVLDHGGENLVIGTMLFAGGAIRENLAKARAFCANS